MFEARIIADRGTLYYAAEATPYDLETLREHLRSCRCERRGDVTLELTLDGSGRSIVAAWIGAVMNAGYQVRVLPQRHAKSAA
jgi:hypothetical protein